MLIERKELLERDIHKLHIKSAQLYLEVVIHGKPELRPEYEEITTKLTDLMIELKRINDLLFINSGKTYD